MLRRLALMEPGSQPTLPHLPRGLAWLSLGLLVLYLVFFLYRALYLIAYPYPTLYVEPYLLEDARLVGQGQNIYTHIQDPPYLAVMYPPFFFAVVGLLFRLFGASYAIGRSVSFVSALLIGALIYKATVDQTRQRLAATAAGLLFFGAHYVYTFVPDFRVDMLGILLAFGGVYVVSRAGDSRWQPVVVASVLFSLAFYTKQSLLVAPVATSLYLLAMGKIRKSLTLAALCVGIIAVLFAVLNHLTQGQFYQHVIVFHALPLDLERPFRETYKCIIMYPVISAFLLVGILWLMSKRIPFSVWYAYLLVSLPVTLISAARVGVSINNFIELWAVGCVVTGITLASILNDSSERVARDMALAALVIQSLAMFHAPFLPQSIQQSYFFYQFMRPDHRVSDAPELQARREMVELIRANRLGTLSFIDGFGNFIDTTDSELIELSPEPFIFEQLRQRGYWDPASFVQRIRNHEFDLIVSRQRLLDYPYEIEEHYRLTDQRSSFFLYEPEFNP